MKVSKNTLASYVVSLTIIALVVTVLYLIIYVLLGAPRLLFIRVSIIMAALSANDYFRQWLRRRSSDPDSEVVYAEIIRIGNSLKSVQWIRMQPPWLLFGITFAWIILSSLLVSLIGGPLPDMMIGKEILMQKYQIVFSRIYCILLQKKSTDILELMIKWDWLHFMHEIEILHEFI